MEIIKLNFENYVPGRSVRENVIACLPGNTEPIKVKGRNDQFYVDRENLRMFIINTEECAPSSEKAFMPNSIVYDMKDRKRLYTRKVMPRGMNIFDYDAYIIAAAEYEGGEEWYGTWVLGDEYESEFFRDSVQVGENRTFHYALVPMFDKGKYLAEYAENNIPGEGQLGWSGLMDKYIYQRTGIDVDSHNETLLVYQNEWSFASILASINWFHDGEPTGIIDDEDFLRHWDAIDDKQKSSREKRAAARIRSNVAVSGVDARIVVDNQRTGENDWDKASETVEYQKGRYLRIIFISRFSEIFEGSLQFGVSHERSGFVSKWGMHKPEKQYCNGEPLSIYTDSFSLDQVLGSGYRIPADCKDFVTVKMFHNNREVFCKDFQIRRTGA